MRNKLLLLAVFLCFMVAAEAQTEKGRLMLSGQTDASILFGKSQLIRDSIAGVKSDVRNFNANVGFGWFVIDNLSIGINGAFEYNYAKESNSVFFDQQYTIGVIPTVRYFFPLKGKLRPDLAVGAGYVWVSSEDMDANGWSLQATPGVSYFVGTRVSINLGIRYSYSDLKRTSDFYRPDYHEQRIGLLAGVSVHF